MILLEKKFFFGRYCQLDVHFSVEKILQEYYTALHIKDKKIIDLEKMSVLWSCFSSLYIMRIAQTIEGLVIHFCFLKQSRGKRVPNIWRTWFMLELVLRFAYSSKTYKCKSKNSRLMFVNTWVELFKRMCLHKYRICKS